MSVNSIYNGRAARQASIAIKKVATSVLMLSAVMLFSSCNHEGNGQAVSHAKNETQTADSLNKPKVNIKVNKRYDDQGKLIQFDSTYSSSYSSHPGDTSWISNINRITPFFDSRYTLFPQQVQNPFADTVKHPRFFNENLLLRPQFRSMEAVHKKAPADSVNKGSAKQNLRKNDIAKNNSK